ncbi:hypothetical protein GF318_03075 [Candidatus Micrarchaeota archaeon]|nr:hypothetical protein [Candidatus Micrarchaeota archaeon]
MKRILMLLVLGFAFAGGDQFFDQPPEEPSEALLEQLNILMSLIVPFMMAMIALAAAAYVIGQMFGAETRARATVWAHGMLAAVGISGLVIVLLYILLPMFMSGQTVPPSVDVQAAFLELKNIAQQSLIFLIGLFIVTAAAAYVLGQFAGANTRAKATVWATGLLAGAVVAAIIYVVIVEIFGRFQAPGIFAGTEALGGYTNIVILIAFFTSIVALITYLLSKAFKVPEWEAYLSIELSNIMSSFILVFFVLGMFAVGDVLASAFVEDAATPPQAAIAFMRTYVADSVLRGLYDIYQIQACTSMLSTITRRIGEFVLTQTYKVFPGMDTFVSITNVIGFGLVSIYGSLSAQIAILYFIDATMKTFFLPAGLVLRFFPPTRDAGAFLIALSFGMQIVFPTTYMINKQVFEDIGAETYESRHLLIASLCGPFKYGVMGVLINPTTNPIFGLMPGGTALGTLLMRLTSETVLNLVSMSEFIPIMRHIASLSLIALFMPALSMMITIAFINAMAKFIVAKV